MLEGWPKWAFNMGRHSTARHNTAQHSTARRGTAQHGTARHGTAQHSTAQHSTAQHSTAQHGAYQSQSGLQQANLPGQATGHKPEALHDIGRDQTADPSRCCPSGCSSGSRDPVLYSWSGRASTHMQNQVATAY